MNKFLAIFGNFIWTKGHSFVDIQNLVILPDNLSFDTDDSIRGEYEDVKVKMTEVYFGWNAIFRTILNHIKNLDALKNIYIVVFLVVALFAILPISNDIKTSLFWSCSAFFMLIWIMGFSTPLIILLLYLFNRRNRGLIVKMSMPKAFDGEIIVFEKGKTNRTVNKKLIKNHTKVELEDVEFNKKYAVYASSNQIEARYVLTTALIERIQNIKFKFNAEYIRFIFRNHSITMFIRTHNDLFRLVKKDKKTDMSEFSVLFEEIYSVLSLVDVLKLNINTGL
ncbi:DUF3137 domain-containing protein [bacterium]|nr:DUF3137 domain-containing protein [bacterium]